MFPIRCFCPAGRRLLFAACAGVRSAASVILCRGKGLEISGDPEMKSAEEHKHEQEPAEIGVNPRWNSSSRH